MSERSSLDPLYAALEDREAFHGLSRGWRIAVAAAILLSSLALLLAVVLFVVQNGQTTENCRKIHRLNVAGDRILDTPRNLRVALDKHQLTPEEYSAALHQVLQFDPLRRQNVRLWRSADCRG